MNRRDALGHLAGITTGLATAASAPWAYAAGSTNPPPRSAMGLVIYDCRFRRRWLRKQNPDFDLFEPLTFLKHCRRLGAGGMQAKLGVMQRDRIRTLRAEAERHSMFTEAIVALPTNKADVERFEAEIRTAKEVGVQAVRTVVISGRRYERFKSLAEFRESEKRGRRMLERAAPVVEKHRVPLAVENHKDHRNDERVALFKHIGSEFVGACVDTGNSFALLEDPVETVEALAPWAKSVHLKDQAVQEYCAGFLLGDIPLGQGCFDLKRIVGILRKARPKIRIALELITRDALQVPCLTGQYWATLPEVPGRDLARTLRIVRQRSAKSLQRVSRLTLKQQVELEDANVAHSLKYARDELGL